MNHLTLKLIPCCLFLLLISAQCQPTPIPPPQPSPLPFLQPSNLPTHQPSNLPLPRGDGSDLLDRLLDTGVLRVGVRVWPDASFSPPAFRGFSNARTGGALNGFEVDVARAVAEGLGLELELVEAYPPALMSGDWRGQWDIAIAGLVPFDGPPQQPLLFSQPYGYLPLGVLIPAADGRIQTLADLAGQPVGLLNHSAEQRLFSPGGPSLTFQQKALLPAPPANLQLVPQDNLPGAIRQLGGSSLQAIIGPSPVLSQAIKSELPVKLAPRAATIATLPLAVATVERDQLKVERLILEINKALDRLRRQGTLAEIYLRWYDQDFSFAKIQP
ncbi:MAG: transporter substrate-binding domain-containing protein [Anaerolineae bacterium]